MKTKPTTCRIELIDLDRATGNFEIETSDATVGRSLAIVIARDAAKARKAFEGGGAFAVYGCRLRAIRDHKLFRFLSGPGRKPITSFRLFCGVIEGISRSKASKLINGARRVLELHKIGATIPNTLAQLEVLLPLGVEDSVAVWKAANAETGTDQPSSIALRSTATRLGLRKRRISLRRPTSFDAKSIQWVVLELDRVAVDSKYSRLSPIIDRLKSLVFPNGVSDSETSPPNSVQSLPAVVAATHSVLRPDLTWVRPSSTPRDKASKGQPNAA